MMGGGYGPGNMHGWGGGSGAVQWNCPAFGQNDGSGPAGRQGEGYGPGYECGVRRWPWHDAGVRTRLRPPRCPASQCSERNQTLNLSTDDVKGRMERWLNWRGNARLKVGEVKEKDADTITADIVTKDNSLVERFIVDRHNGVYRQDNS